MQIVRRLRKGALYIFIFIVISTYFFPGYESQFVTQSEDLTNLIDSGHVLFTPMLSKKTYLINGMGDVEKSWSSNFLPGFSVYMLADGSIIRTIELPFLIGGGGIEHISADGELLWHYEYYAPDSYQSHHDIEPLPNGNVLVVAFELKSPGLVIKAGRNPAYVPTDNVEVDYIVEIKPTGPTTGEIIWEWHIWDHLIQDYDETKENYGKVEDHPELFDINYGSADPDWLHCNSIDYNAEFDQIMINCRNFNEIWVIDHSTTTDEAANHSGGIYGQGGDLLYRWGNPRAYRTGTTADQQLYMQHDAQWIPKGYPGEGNILVFNNGVGRYYSSVDEFEPPMNSTGFYFQYPGVAYGPTQLVWSYIATPPNSFYASFISGCQRLPNGNTLICDGPGGKFFEVTPSMNVVWEYQNNFPSTLLNNVFKVQYIPPEVPVPHIPDLDCEGNIGWTKIKPGSEATGIFVVQNCGDNLSLLNWTIESVPNWGNWSCNPSSGVLLSPDDGYVVVEVSVIAPQASNEEFEGYIRVVNMQDATDFDVIPVKLKTMKENVYSGTYANYLPALQWLSERIPIIAKLLFQIFLVH